MLTLLVLSACAGGIRSLYEAERDRALARAAPPEEGWMPDLRVRISNDALDGLTQAVLAQGLGSWSRSLRLDGPLGVKAEVRPSARLTELLLAPATACDGCLRANLEVEGRAAWTAAGASGSVPFTARLGGTLAFELSRVDAAWEASGRLVSVDRVEVRVERLGSLDATGLLGDALAEAVRSTGPVSLGRFGGADLPLRAARLATPRGLLELQLLSDVAEGEPVSAGLGLEDDLELRISTPTALALARRAAFERGAVAYDVAAIPTSLRVEEQRFLLGLRLWKLAGIGWWRDYEVEGSFGLVGGELRLAADKATEGAASKGAGLADPLALLAEGRILEAIPDALRGALPAAARLSVGEQTWQARLRSARGERGVLVLSGSLGQVAAGEGRSLGR